jgi:hypothetical protein
MTRHFGILTRDFIEQADCSPISRPCAGDGKALKQHQIRTAEPVSGDLIVGYENVSTLGRWSDTAHVRAGDGGQDEPLPPLYDVKLSHMGSTGSVVSGLEMYGSRAVAQAWWCRMER